MSRASAAIKRVDSWRHAYQVHRIARQRYAAITKLNPQVARHRRSPTFEAAFRGLWHERLKLPIGMHWHDAFAAITGVEDHRYLPEPVFTLHVEHVLNDLTVAKAHADKNQADRMFPDVRRAETVLRRIHGRCYGGDYRPLPDATAALRGVEPQELVIKPAVDSGGGTLVRVVRVSDGRFETEEGQLAPEEALRAYPGDVIVQRLVRQHSVMDAIYPHAVNTLRIMTLRYQGRIRTLSAVARFGRAGGRTDNVGAGGVACGITPDGMLRSRAYDKHARAWSEHPDTGAAFGGVQVPAAAEAFAMTAKLHERLLSTDLVSWDVAIDQDAAPVLIEYNLRSQEIVFHHLANGPLFGDLTEPLLTEVIAARRARR